MGVISVIPVYYVEIIIGFGITFLTTLLYGLFAPWYKSDTGRAFFTLLIALSTLLFNSVIRTYFKTDFTLYLGMILFGLYCIAMIHIAWYIYKAQIHDYYLSKKKRH